MSLQDDLRDSTRSTQSAITRDESSLRAVQQTIIIRRNALAALIEAIDKAIGGNRRADDIQRGAAHTKRG